MANRCTIVFIRDTADRGHTWPCLTTKDALLLCEMVRGRARTAFRWNSRSLTGRLAQLTAAGLLGESYSVSTSLEMFGRRVLTAFKRADGAPVLAPQDAILQRYVARVRRV